MVFKKLCVISCILVLAGCVSPRELLGWAADEPFTLTPADQSEFATQGPLFSKGIENVAFSLGKVCTGCGDFSDNHGIGVAHVNMRL